MHHPSKLENEASREKTPRLRYTANELRAERRASQQKLLGKVIDNRYKVVEVIGQGGMGVVYKIKHQRMGKIAALKMLRADLARNPDISARFHREAEAVSRLNHPNAVQVFDFGMFQSAPYLVMEYLPGIDMGALLARDGPLPFNRAAPLFAQICAALSEAHELGVIHRDLKPDNVLVTRTRQGHDLIKVLDFGLAKLVKHKESAKNTTARGTIVGTPYYMSPEQIHDTDVDARSDIYSMGALMFKMLTGTPPFDANSPLGVLTKHLTDPPPLPSKRRPDLAIPPQVDQLVLRALQKSPSDRPQSANALIKELESSLEKTAASSKTSHSLLSHSSPHPANIESPPPGNLPSLVGQCEADASDDYRLRRSDLEIFERQLKRRRWLHAALIPILMSIASAFAYYWFVWRLDQPQTHELEPNNQLAQATLIRRAALISGRLGKRLNKTTADRDFFTLASSLANHSLITVHLESQPTIDMKFELIDNAGKTIVRVNDQKLGTDEWLRRYRVEGKIHIFVSEVETKQFPTETISDQYQFSLNVVAPDPGLESEPNNLPSDANPLPLQQKISAYLDRKNDVDCFVFAGPNGHYRVQIDGFANMPLQWQVDHNKPTSKRNAQIKLKKGAIIKVLRPDDADPMLAQKSLYSLQIAP